MVSFPTAYGRCPDHPLRAYAIAKIAADRHLQTTDLDWTILGPGPADPGGAHRSHHRGPRFSRAPRLEGADVPRGNGLVSSPPCSPNTASIGKVIPSTTATPRRPGRADVPQEYADLS